MDNYKSDFVEFKTIDEKYPVCGIHAKPIECDKCKCWITGYNMEKHQQSIKCNRIFNNPKDYIKCKICLTLVIKNGLKSHQKTYKCKNNL